MPFKLGRGGAGGTASAPSVGEPAQPQEAHSYVAGTRRIELGGHVIATPEHDIRAAILLPLGGDERGDALLALQDAAGRPMLAHMLGDGDGLGGMELSDELVAADVTCSIETLAFEALGTAFVRLHGALACYVPDAVNPQPQTPAAQATPGARAANAPPAPPAPPEPAEPSAAHDAPSTGTAAAMPATAFASHDWLLRAEAPPRVLEELQLDAPGEPTEPAIATSWQAHDLDADGHDDVSLTLTLSFSGEEPNTIALPLFDRPSGLARDGKEPEASWLALADEAKSARKSQPQRAAQLATRVLRAHAALCRESGRARLWLHGERGLPCGASLAAGRAATIEIALLARKGQMLEALERDAQLDSGAYRLTDNDRERASYALSERVLRDGLVWRKGPSLHASSSLAARRSALAFLDEGHLVLRGSGGVRVLDLASAAIEPAGDVPGLLVTSPSGKVAISALDASCEGVHAHLVSASQVVAGVVAGAELAAPLLLEPETGADCSSSTAAVTPVELIDWTSAGVVLARGRSLFVVPLDDAGTETAPASEIGGDVALPALRYPATLTPDGRTRALRTSLGVALHERASGTAKVLAWPSEVTAASVTDVALSPSGQRIALLAGGSVYIGEPAPAPVTAATATAATTTAAAGTATTTALPSPPEPSDAPAQP